ncbi:hypothetical protein SALBM217S_09592 [Streptomyces griseoloalbus]
MPGGEVGRVGGGGDLGQRGGRAEGAACVEGVEFGEEHAEGPAVGHDVVGEKLEPGGAVGEGPDGDAPERAGREVHGGGGAGVRLGARPGAAGVGVEVGEVGDGEVGYRFGRRGDGAPGPVAGGEGGAQDGVPVGEGAQGGGEAVGVEGAVGLGVVAEDVGGGARVDLLEQSQAELDRVGLGGGGCGGVRCAGAPAGEEVAAEVGGYLKVVGHRCRPPCGHRTWFSAGLPGVGRRLGCRGSVSAAVSPGRVPSAPLPGVGVVGVSRGTSRS